MSARPIRSWQSALALALAAWLLGIGLLGGNAAAAETDDGRLMVDAMEYPWSAIGRLNAGGRAHCTGFLVGPRHVMTAAHCLYDKVEGRWRGANELHFVAGYQQDRFILHAGVAGYERAAGFDPRAKPSGRGAVADWALLRLDAPLGESAGWLGLERLEGAALAAVERGQAHVLQAGYRNGRAHAMTANGRCRLIGWFAEKRGFTHDCPVYRGDSGGPLLLFSDGRFQAVGLQVLNARSGGQTVGGALSLSLFAKGGEAQARRALDGLDCGSCDGRPPAAGSAAAALPQTTIDRLLIRLGYLTAGGNAGSRPEAIRAFESDQALPPSGEASLALLGHLLAGLR